MTESDVRIGIKFKGKNCSLTFKKNENVKKKYMNGSHCKSISVKAVFYSGVLPTFNGPDGISKIKG